MGLATRLAFRLVFAYELLYNFPFPLNLLPWSDKILAWHEALFSKMTIWTGTHILHLSSPLACSFYAGGDSMFGWAENLVKIMLAVAAAVIWSLLDHKRPNYRKLRGQMDGRNIQATLHRIELKSMPLYENGFH